MLNITIVGMGYVGISMAALMSKNNMVTIQEIDKVKRESLFNKEIESFDSAAYAEIRRNCDRVSICDDTVMAYKNADIVIICVPTNYVEGIGGFDISIVQKVISDILQNNDNVLIVIKSTIPIGYTDSLINGIGHKRILYNPEFLREETGYRDALNPDRIIIGFSYEQGIEDVTLYVKVLRDSLCNDKIPFLLMNFKEAEATKLFSNAYLAMRVAFFNEVDTFAEENSIDVKKIIKGISKDRRIGDFYNNPSFGYGGYCLPKDTKQLLHDFNAIPQKLIRAIVESNEIRKDYISHNIIRLCSQMGIDSIVVGIYRLNMKKGSNNIKNSAIVDIIYRIYNLGYNIIIYEPLIDGNIPDIMGCSICRDLSVFKRVCNLIIANRKDKDLTDVSYKVYTRDVFEYN